MTVPLPSPQVAQSLQKAIAALAAFRSGLQPPQSSWPARLAAAVVALDRVEASPVVRHASNLALDVPFHALSQRAASVIQTAQRLTDITQADLLTMPRSEISELHERCERAASLIGKFNATQAVANQRGFQVEALALAYEDLMPHEDDVDHLAALARIEASCVKGFAFHGAACALLAELGIATHPADTIATIKALADCLIDTIDLPEAPASLIENVEEAEGLARSVARLLGAAEALDAEFGGAWRNQSAKRLFAAAAILRGEEPSRLSSVKSFCADICASEDPDALDRMARVVEAWGRMTASPRGRALFGDAWDSPGDVIAQSMAAAGWSKAARRHDPALIARLVAVAMAKRSQCQAIAADVIDCDHDGRVAIELASYPDHLDARLATALRASATLTQVPIALARDCSDAVRSREASSQIMREGPIAFDIDPADLGAQCSLVADAHETIGSDLVSSLEARASAVAFSRLVLIAAEEIAPLPDAFLPGPLATAREIRLTLSTRMAAHHAARDPEKLRGLVAELGGSDLLQRLEAEHAPAQWSEEAGRFLSLAA